MNPTSLLLDSLAAYRLTKLVVDDQLTAEARDAVIEAAYARAGRREEVTQGYAGRHDWAEIVANDDDPPKLAFLVSCPWCAGMWVSLGVVVLDAVAPGPWRHMRRALAMSAAAGLIAENLQH